LAARLEGELAALGEPSTAARSATSPDADKKRKPKIEVAPEPPATPPTATTFLASVLDLRGSVDLARSLGARVPEASAHMEQAQALRARLRARVQTIARGVATTRVVSLPGVPSYGAGALLSALRVAGVLDEPDARAFDRATRALWSPVATAIARRAARAAAELDAVFTEEATSLAALGGRGAYVLALDALLDRVTDAGTTPLLDRPAELLVRRFSILLRREAAALPEGATEEHVAPWSRPGGFVDVQLGLGDAYLRALVEHRVRRALALVDAACATTRAFEEDASRPA
jgi:hypothetical protein